MVFCSHSFFGACSLKKYSLPVDKNRMKTRPAPFHKKHASLKHCIDFALPVGSVIRASRSGIVIRTESRYSKSFDDPRYASRVNRVEIEHQDGAISVYLHLAWRSIRVRKGQKVRRKKMLGLSGQTGYATYPHLHFGVYDANMKNIKIELDD